MWTYNVNWQCQTSHNLLHSVCVCVCPSAPACVCVYVVKFVVVIAVPCRTCLLYCFHRSFDRMHENQNDLLRIGRNKVKQTHISLHWLCFVWFYCDFFFLKKGPFSFPHNQLCSFSFLFLVCRFAPYIPVKYANGFFLHGLCRLYLCCICMHCYPKLKPNILLLFKFMSYDWHYFGYTWTWTANWRKKVI